MKEFPNLVCPNCGSTDIAEKWVETPAQKKPTEQFDEYAKKQLTNPPHSNIFSIDINAVSGMELRNFTQFNLRCGECGYTRVYDVNGKK